MFNWLFSKLEKAVRTKNYRILHEPDLGYLPQKYCHITVSWQAIEPDLTLGVYGDSARSFNYLWHKTEASAGSIINRYATSNGGKIVWEG